MMKMNNSIRKSFYVIVSTMIAFFLLVFLCFMLFILIKSSKESEEFYRYTLKSVEVNINKSMNRIWEMNDSIIYDSELQELLCDGRRRRTEVVEKIDRYVSAYSNVDDNLKYVALVDMKGEYYDVLGSRVDLEVSSLARRILNTYSGNDADGEFYFFDMTSGDEIVRYFAILTPVYEIDRAEFVYKKRIGKFVSVYSQELFLQSIRAASYEIVDEIVIADKNDIIRISQSRDISGKRVEHGMYSDKIPLRFGGLSLHSKPFDLYESEPRRSLTFILVTVFILLMITMLIINHWFKRYVITDVTKIMGVLKDNQNGVAKKRIQVRHHNEFTDIAENINAMLDSMEEYNRRAFFGQQRMYEMELQLNKMRIYMLKNQVNPHFLYNTLGCIRSLALDADMKDIADITESTISLLRYNLKENERVLLEREISECEKYIRVINVRYENVVKLTCEAEPDALKTEVIKMVLQPVVENAVYHGMVSPNSILRIDISAVFEDGILKLSVSDNGSGIDEERLNEIRRNLESDEGDGKHIGLYNVHKRIVMEYGDEYGVKIYSVAGNGTKVDICIPADSRRKNHENSRN